MHSTRCPICTQIFRRGDPVIQFDGRSFHPECYRTNRQRVLSGIGFQERWTSNHFLRKLREFRSKVCALRNSNGIQHFSKTLEQWTNIVELDNLLASAKFNEASNSFTKMKLQSALSKEKRELNELVTLFQESITSEKSRLKGQQHIEKLPDEYPSVLNQMTTRALYSSDRIQALHNEIMTEVENSVEWRRNKILCAIKEIPKKVKNYTC